MQRPEWPIKFATECNAELCFIKFETVYKQGAHFTNTVTPVSSKPVLCGFGPELSVLDNPKTHTHIHTSRGQCQWPNTHGSPRIQSEAARLMHSVSCGVGEFTSSVNSVKAWVTAVTIKVFLPKLILNYILGNSFAHELCDRFDFVQITRRYHPSGHCKI